MRNHGKQLIQTTQKSTLIKTDTVTKRLPEESHTNLRDLLQFIDVQDKRLKEYYNELTDPEKIVLARTVKLTEELGELCQAVLACLSLQRPQKLDKQDKDKLPEEFADVLVTTLLLAKSMEIDVENALEKKIQTINTRFKQI